MEMRHGWIQTGLLVCCLALLGGCAKSEDPAPAMPAAAKAATEPATPPAPVVVKPAEESDAVALSEEELDRVKTEQAELASREADLKAQVEDGEMIIAMKEKQIRELEARLKQGASAKK